MANYTKEKLWKFYEKLPEELKDAIFSEETAESIWNTCDKNNVDEVSEIAQYVGRVLLGVLAPEDFQEALEKEMKLKKEVAKKVSQEIHRFVFFPVKESLALLYKIEVAPPGLAPFEKPEKITPTETVPRETEVPEEKPEKPDIYRESTE